MIKLIAIFLKNVWNNVIARFAIIVMLAIIILTIVTSMMIQPGDNYKLTADEKKLQKDIQKSTDRSDARIAEVMVQDGDWTLAKINSTEQPGNYAMVIMKNDQLIAGPASNFSLGYLVDTNIPDKIIDNLYPEKPQWANFSDNFDSYFPYSQDQVKFVINAAAQQLSIQLKRVNIINGGEINRSVENPRENNRTETTEFKFVINSNTDTVYTFRSIYHASTMTIDYLVLDNSGSIVYSQTVKI